MDQVSRKDHRGAAKRILAYLIAGALLLALVALPQAQARQARTSQPPRSETGELRQQTHQAPTDQRQGQIPPRLSPRLRAAHARLYPRFSPDRHDYAVRCHAGATAVFEDHRRRGQGLQRITRRLPRSGRLVMIHSYRLRCLPRDFPAWSFQQLRPLDHSGRFVVSIPRPRPWIIAFDTSGAPVWWKQTPTNAENAKISSSGVVSWERAYGDSYARDSGAAVEQMMMNGKRLRTLRLPNGELIDGHEFQRLPSGNVLVISYVPQSDQQLGALLNQGAVAAVWPVVYAINPKTGAIIWSWSARGHIALDEIEAPWWGAMVAHPNPSAISPTTYDPLHLNSVEPFDPALPGAAPEIIVSSRRTNAIYAVSRSTGAIVWKLGGTQTPDSLTVLGDPHLQRGQTLFGGQHDVRINGNVLSVYDDRSRTGQPPRAVFYHLDLANRTATFVRQLTDPEIKSSSWGGSVREFAGGYLVDWGGTNRVTVFDHQGEIMERFRLPGVSYRANPIPAKISTRRLLMATR